MLMTEAKTTSCRYAAFHGSWISQNRIVR